MWNRTGRLFQSTDTLQDGSVTMRTDEKSKVQRRNPTANSCLVDIQIKAMAHIDQSFDVGVQLDRSIEQIDLETNHGAPLVSHSFVLPSMSTSAIICREAMSQ